MKKTYIISCALVLNLLVTAQANEGVRDYRSLRYAGVVGQTLDYTCGPAALATLLTHYYGRPVPERVFIERSVADMEARGKSALAGLTLRSLREALKAEGIPSKGYKLTIEQLRQVMTAGLPVMSHMVRGNGNYHFYLVLAINEADVLLADPSWGVRSQPLTDFLHAFSGMVLIPQPSIEEAAYAQRRVGEEITRYVERINRLLTGG